MTEELNRRHNLATMPTINNNGESYIVPFDIYKEGYDAYDISNWFKGRVGDNGTPFGIRWYKHGQLMDVTGMRPFIEGQVGDYTIDDSDPDDPKINMDSEASNVHVVGEVNDCQEYGVAIYRLINQAMPQSGIFYGKIGVMGTQDDGTTVMSSVDVVFKVLASHMSMVGARKFYVSELEKALLDFKAKIKASEKDFQTTLDQHNQDFQKKTQQVIDDARNTYETETKNSHDAALAANAELSKLREDITKASHSIGDVQNQIDADNIVTTNDFKTVTDETKNLINDRLKNISLAPQAFASLDDLKQKYPSGADGLFRVGNEGYIWENNAWTSTGEIASTMISDADFNQRLGSFMFFDNGKDTSATVTDQEVDSTTKKRAVKLTITAGTLIYLANSGFFKSPSPTDLEVTGTYLPQDVNSKGLLTLYFDNASTLYFAYAPERRNDLKLFSVYYGKLYGGLNIKNIYSNGIADGGWGHLNRQGYAMYLPLWNNQPIRVTFNTVSIDSKDQNTYQVVVPDNVSYATLDGKKSVLKPATLNITTGITDMPCLFTDAKGNPYLDYQGHSSDDVLLATLFNKFAYGIDVRAFVVNGIDNGGFGHSSKNALMMAQIGDDPIKVNFDGNNLYTVEIPQSLNLIDQDNNHLGYSAKSKKTIKYQTTNPNTIIYLFLDRNFNPYIDITSHDPTDYRITALYRNHAFGDNNQDIIVNNINNGGFGNNSKPGYAMYLPLWNNQPIRVTFNTVSIDSKDQNTYQVVVPDNVSYATLDGKKSVLKPATLNITTGITDMPCLFTDAKGNPYLDYQGHSSDDVLLATLFNKFAYGVNVQNIIVNNINNGGFGNNSKPGYAMYLPLWNNQPIRVTFKAISVDGQAKNSYQVVVPDNVSYAMLDGKKSVLKSATLNITTGIADMPCLFTDAKGNPYLDYQGHSSDDVLLATLFNKFAYGVNVQNIVVNGITNGGFGDFEYSYDLNGWRIKAENKESANIAWLGDSTFQGYKTSSPDHIAGNYLNKLLPNDYIGVTSYVCAIGGYTTRDLYNHFDDLIKLNGAKDIGLVLIGGGLNDSGNIQNEQHYLDLVIKKVRLLGATPVIVTTQATALLNTNHDQGDDWTGKRNNDFARTNQIRREYAKIHNIDLIDLEKYQNAYVEYGPAKLNEMFDDYLHGHDDMHKFGAEFIFSELAADYVDIIKKPKVISVTTMKAKSDLMAHKTNFELTDSSLNRKGFKASMKRTDVTSDQIVIDYQFFIPASEEQYYLNGYNLGDPVNVSLNGDITQLTGTQKVATLEPGYYHVIVKPTTANINFVGLRIETDNLTESTVQPASGTTPQAQPTEQNKDSDKQ